MLRSPEFPVLLQFETRRRELDDELLLQRQRAAAAKSRQRRRPLLGLVRSSSRAARPAGDCA